MFVISCRLARVDDEWMIGLLRRLSKYSVEERSEKTRVAIRILGWKGDRWM